MVEYILNIDWREYIMNKWDSFRKFVDIQKGNANYNEWKKEIEEAASQLSKDELENDIKKYEIVYQKKKLQSGTTFGVCSYLYIVSSSFYNNISKWYIFYL